MRRSAGTLSQVLALALVASVSACRDASGPTLDTRDSVSPSPTAFVQKLGGDTQTAVVGTQLASPVSVRIVDHLGRPLPGAEVEFAVTRGDGSVSQPEMLTGADGTAFATWTVGTAAGATNAISVRVAGQVVSDVFTATGLARPASVTSAAAGDNQISLIGTPVPAAPTVRVTDVFGNPVAGIAVTFSVTDGGGTIASLAAVTGSNGTASAGQWTLGSSPGTNHLTAEIAGLGSITFTAIATLTPPVTNFTIQVRFLTTVTPNQRRAFENAAARWQAVIVGDLPDAWLSSSGGSCGANSPAMNEIIDDVVILATIGPIDGVGGTLGRAGPCYIRAQGSLPELGMMEFDAADLANLESNGQLEATVLHEMGHVLGFGTLWKTLGLLADPSLPSRSGADTRFTGATAIGGFNQIGGMTYVGGGKVPVENVLGGSGTRDVHWRETVFGAEIMTGFLNQGANPLSVATIGALRDMGYDVSLAQSDAFFIGAALRDGAAEAAPQSLGDDVIDLPLRHVTPQGVVTQVTPR